MTVVTVVTGAAVMSGLLATPSGLLTVALRLVCRLVIRGIRLGSQVLREDMSFERTELTSPTSSADRPAPASRCPLKTDPLVVAINSGAVMPS